MPSIVHALGELEHIHNKRNLKLMTSGSITLSSPQASESQSLGRTQDIETLVSSNIWVAGGNRLQIHFRIFFDDVEILGSDNSDVIEDLGTVLCKAEIWSQLCLKASLSLPESNTGSQGSPRELVISLTGQPSSHAIVMPPKGAPVVCLEAINLTLKFSPCRRSRTLERPQSYGVRPKRNLNSIRRKEAYVTYEHQGQYWSSLQASRGWGNMTREDQEIGRPWTTTSSTNDSEHQRDSNQRQSITVSPPDSHDSISYSDTLVSRTNRPIPFCGHPFQSRHAIHEINFEDMLKLVNASLYTMIVDRMPGTRGNVAGIIMSGDAGYPKLAALSPVLFSPGYAQAIWQRSRLISAIAHTLSGIHRRTRSTILMHALERLLDTAAGRHLEQDVIESPDPGFKGRDLIAAINVRLWFLTQRKLFDPFAARRLKPLDASMRTIDRVDGSNDILEETPVNGGNIEPLLDYTDDDQLLDSQSTLMEDGIGHGHNVFDEPNHMEGDEFHDMLEAFPIDGGDNDSRLASQDDGLVFESQRTLVEEKFGYGGKVNEILDLIEAEDCRGLADELLMDGDTLVEYYVADEDLFWEESGSEEETGGASQDQGKSTTTWNPLDDNNHELLDDGRENMLIKDFSAVHDECSAEDHFGGFPCQDEMLEDMEMG